MLDGEHRDVVKQAFNAMVQASSPLTNCPNDIDLTELDMSWAELRDRIIKHINQYPMSSSKVWGITFNLKIVV